MTAADDDYPRAPDLGEWVEKYGSYQNIPWREWDEAMAAWHVARRIYTAGHINEPTTQGTAPTRRRAR